METLCESEGRFGGIAMGRSLGQGVWLRAIVALAGVVAAASAGVAARELRLFEYHPPLEKLSMMGVPYMGVSDRAQAAAVLRETAACFALFGAVLALFLGLAGTTGRWTQGVFKGLAGAVIGASVCAAAAFLVIPIYERAEAVSDGGLPRSLLLHSGLWAPLGFVAAAVAAWGMGSATRALAAGGSGAIGTIVAVVLYDLAAAALYPLDHTGQPLATVLPARIMLFAAVALGAAAGTILGLPPARPEPATPA